jgi:hypothetical protein
VAKSQFAKLGIDDDGEIFEWLDSGRRGNPTPGCDCEACFGMCIGDKYAFVRARAEGYDQSVKLRRERELRGIIYDGAPLDMGDME